MAKLFKNNGVGSYAKYDNYVTSKEGWDCIKKYIPDNNPKVWCPFYHGGEVTDLFDYKNKIHKNKDFFFYEPKKWDIIVDNPPYTIKEKVIKRCVELNKPFALLLPLETVERQYFKKLIADNENINFTLVIPSKRIKFLKDGGEVSGSNPCVTCWFLFNILPASQNNQIIFN